jgi:hypothetical protein
MLANEKGLTPALRLRAMGMAQHAGACHRVPRCLTFGHER